MIAVQENAVRLDGIAKLPNAPFRQKRGDKLPARLEYLWQFELSPGLPSPLQCGGIT